MTTTRPGSPARRPAAARRPAPRPAPRRRPGRRRRPSGALRQIVRSWPVLLLVVGVVIALAWDTDDTPATPVAAGCRVTDSAVTLTTEQAANAATIAAVARNRGLPERATVIALATAQQESGLRNLDYGDRDSLGLFQQRPSQGWGTPEQVTDPVYAANAFYDGLVEVPGWETGRLTEVSQAVQRSGFPEAYQQHEPMAQSLATALLIDSPGQLSCTFTPADAAGPLDDRTSAVATTAGRELGLTATAAPDGVVQVDPSGGWPAAKWAVAHAERLQLGGVRLAGWQWTPLGGWAATATDSPDLVLSLTT